MRTVQPQHASGVHTAMAEGGSLQAMIERYLIHFNAGAEPGAASVSVQSL